MARSHRTAREAGTKFETSICEFLKSQGWIHAERRRMAGAQDRGDIAGIPGLVIEAKNTNRLDLSGALDEALAECNNANAAVGVAWIKRRGRSSAADAYVVMDGNTFAALLKEAGY